MSDRVGAAPETRAKTARAYIIERCVLMMMGETFREEAVMQQNYFSRQRHCISTILQS
jgi:hypothetical protein